MDQPTEDEKPDFEDTQHLFLQNFVDKVENGTGVSNAQAHESTLTAFVEYETEVVNHIKHRLMLLTICCCAG